MKIGAKSILFGAHQFLIHPWYVAAAWHRLYGFPADLRLWVAFFVHDLGYIGKADMDGVDGEQHVHLGAKIMRRLFDRPNRRCPDCCGTGNRPVNVLMGGAIVIDYDLVICERCNYWYYFALLHSRFVAKGLDMDYSRLCVADKYAICLTPEWLYLFLTNLSGEIHEYMALSKTRTAANEHVSKYESMRLNSGDQRAWYAGLQDYLSRWVDEHKDGREDSWTPKLVRATD